MIEIIAGTYDQQILLISINEIVVFHESVTLADTSVKIALPRKAILPGEQNWLEFRIPNARSPGTNDRRKLGFYIKQLSFL